MKLTLRTVGENDETFLYKLFCSTRDQEMALTNWSQPQQQMFLQMQFIAQRSHYATFFPKATHSIIYLRKQAVGHLMINRTSTEIHLVDITIAPEYRGKGIGTQLLQELIAESNATKIPVTLQVFKGNAAAMRLYKRLGFVTTGEVATHFQMQYLL